MPCFCNPLGKALELIHSDWLDAAPSGMAWGGAVSVAEVKPLADAGTTMEAREDDGMQRSFDSIRIACLLPIKQSAPWVVAVCRSTGVAPCKGRAGVLAPHFMHCRGNSCSDQYTQQGGKKPGPGHSEVARDGRLGFVAARSVCGIAAAAIKSSTIAVLTAASTAFTAARQPLRLRKRPAGIHRIRKLRLMRSGKEPRG